MASIANELSRYIVSLAGAASAAQQRISTQDNPMQIKEYRVKVNIAADIRHKEDGDHHMKVTNLTLRDKFLSDYKEEMGVQLDLTMVPAALIESS